VSLYDAETPHGEPGSSKNNAKNRLALENAANEDRNCCSTQFFSTLLELETEFGKIGLAAKMEISGDGFAFWKPDDEVYSTKSTPAQERTE
jgi:hypothetical protein